MRLLLSLIVFIGVSVTHAVVPLPQCQGDNVVIDTLPEVAGAYKLTYDSGTWSCESRDAAGHFYAEQTKRQLLAEYPGDMPLRFCVQDYPTYQWRGLHLDVSRHFFSKETVMQLIDRMAELKLNRLHLHLTDGPGWRIEIKRFPLLTQHGAWRKKLPESSWNWHAHQLGPHHPELYGGFYTQQDMKEMIAYALSRHVVIVPEIDMPGHFAAALEAYPHLAHPAYKTGNWPYSYDFLNVQDPLVLEFACGVLDEIMAIFPPGTPIHVGGDEVDLHLMTAEQQRVFVQYLVDYLLRHGYPAVTWDEAATNGVRGQIVMLWRAEKAQDVLSIGLPTVLCPNSHFYFDYPQSDSTDEPESMPAPVISVEKVFGYCSPALPNVIGMQGNLWSEYIYTPELLFHKAFPRAAALSERAWGSPMRDYTDFARDYANSIEKRGQE